MTSPFTKRKMFIIATCLFLVTMSTVLFLVGENKLNIDHNDLKAYVLQSEEMETPQTEAFYRELFNNTDDDIFILKQDTTIQFSTDTWRERLGYLKEDVEEKNFFTFIHPKDLPFFANEMVELVNNGEDKPNIGPFRIKDSEGQYKLYMAHGVPLKEEKEDKTIGIGLILTDVSIPLGGDSMIPTALASNIFPL